MCYEEVHDTIPAFTRLYTSHYVTGTVDAALLGHFGSRAFWPNKVADVNRQTYGMTSQTFNWL